MRMRTGMGVPWPRLREGARSYLQRAIVFASEMDVFPTERGDVRQEREPDDAQATSVAASR